MTLFSDAATLGALRHLVEPPDAVAVPFRPDIQGWRAGGAILFLDVHAGWCLALEEDDREAVSLAEAVRLLGPECGSDAVSQTAEAAQQVSDPALRAAWMEDLAEGEEALRRARRAAQEVHVAHAAQIATGRAQLSVDSGHGVGTPSFDYLTRTVQRISPGRWVVRAGEDDADPALLRLWTQPEPGDIAGWKRSRASQEGNSHRWAPVDVTGACELVGPLHVGDIAQTTRALRDAAVADLARRLEHELDAAALALCAHLDALAQDHARRAVALAPRDPDQ